MIKGLLTGIGIGIGIMAVKEAKKAYDKNMFERKIKDFWANIKKAFNETEEEAN